MAVVGERAWNYEQRDRAKEHDPVERALRRLQAARRRGELTADELETMRRILSPPRLGWHAWERPLWTRW